MGSEAKPKHRPGPWIVTRSQFNPPQITAADGSLVTDRVFNGNEDLAGASPELLAACESFVTLFRESDMWPEDECHEVYREMIAAIAKAKGGQS